MEKLLMIEASNKGDMSVGIWGLRAKITIEANVDMDDVLSDINYKDNREKFVEDIKNLLIWIDDMPSEVDKIEIK